MRIAVIGAGNGGQATAAYLGMSGHAVRLFDRYPDAIDALRSHGHIRAVGAVEGSVSPEILTTDMGEAVDGAELILVSVPGFALPFVAEGLAPHLRGPETIVLHPGGLGGALEVRRIWDALGVPGSVTLAETDTLFFACRLRSPGEVDVKAVKRRLLLATLPAGRVDGILGTVRALFPPVSRASNVLETSLANLNPVIHPAITMLNTGPIERGDGSFDFYGEGVTPSTARLLTATDDERLMVAEAAGVPAIPLLEWAPIAYGVGAKDLESLYPLLAQHVYQGIGRPHDLKARYVTEDVPLGMVPMSVLGRITGVSTPVTDAVVQVMSTMTGTDFATTGRTARSMGIEGFGRDELLRYVATGEGGPPPS